MKAHTDPIFSRLELLKLDDTYKISVFAFMHNYHYDKLPYSFTNMYTPLADPNRTKSYN